MARKEWHKHQVFDDDARIALNRDLVQHIAAHVDEPTVSKLHRALANETRILALEVEARELILRAPRGLPRRAHRAPRHAPPGAHVAQAGRALTVV